MDEQQMNQPIQQPEQPQPTNPDIQPEAPELEPQDTDAGNSSGDLAPDGIALVDGDIKLGDDFFSGLENVKEAEGDGHTEPEEPSPQSEQNQSEQAQGQPNQYSDEELKNTPFEQWDMSRVTGDVKRYALVIQAQLQQRAVQNAVQSRPIPPLPESVLKDIGEAPKPYTPKELSDEARKLACEKLGIKDAEDFDDYDGEHKAALEMSMQELIKQRDIASGNYQRVKASWEALNRFNAELEQQPDYREFCQWYVDELPKSNMTPLQMNELVFGSVKNNGYDFGIAQQTILNWYKTFRGIKRQSQAQAQPKIRPKAKPPAPLESSHGNSYPTGHRVNLSEFGCMSPDEQAQELIKLGLVP